MCSRKAACTLSRVLFFAGTSSDEVYSRWKPTWVIRPSHLLPEFGLLQLICVSFRDL